MIDGKTQPHNIDHNTPPRVFLNVSYGSSPPLKTKTGPLLFFVKYWCRITVVFYYLLVHKNLMGRKKVREKDIQDHKNDYHNFSSCNTPKKQFHKIFQGLKLFCVFFFFFLLTTVLDMWFKIFMLVKKKKVIK